jgi:hypothetical protein
MLHPSFTENKAQRTRRLSLAAEKGGRLSNATKAVVLSTIGNLRRKLFNLARVK